VDDLKDVLATNVNEEVAVFRGSSANELIHIAILASGIIVPIMTFLGFLIGKATIALSLSLVVVFIAIVVLCTLMQHIRRGRPEGYFEHRVILFKSRIGWGKCPFFVMDGELDNHRTKQCVLISKHLSVEELL